MGKNNKIRSAVRIRQMPKQWQKKTHNKIDLVADIPPGHVAVSVGVNRRRYVVRAKHLNHSIFRLLLKEAEEEYGFSNISPLAIPCDESLFEEIIGVLTRSKPCGRDNMATLEYIRRCIHVWMAEKMECIYMPISAVAFCHCWKICMLSWTGITEICKPSFG